MRKTLFPLLSLSLMLLASPAWASKPSKPPSYSGALKIAKKFSPTKSATIIEPMPSSSVPAGSRGFAVNFNSLCTPGSCWSNEIKAPRIEVVVTRSAPADTVKATYYGIDNNYQPMALYERSGPVNDIYQQGWSFTAAGRPVDPEGRSALRDSFVQAAAWAVSFGPGLSSLSNSVVLVSQAPFASIDGRTVVLASPGYFGNNLTNIQSSWAGLPAAAGIYAESPLSGSPVILSEGPSPAPMLACGSKLTLTVTGKRPGQKRTFRKKATGLQMVCI